MREGEEERGRERKSEEAKKRKKHVPASWNVTKAMPLVFPVSLSFGT